MDDPRHATKRLFPSRLTRRQALVGVGLALAVPRIGTGRAAPATPETGSRLAAHPPWAEIEATLPKTAARLAGAIERGGGGQLSVSRRGTVVVDAGWGATGAGAAITADSLVPWASASKPTTCVALMRLVEAGRLGLDDRVVEHIPEFGANGKEGVLVRHLLTHTAHLGGYDGPVAAARENWDRTIAKIVAAPLAEGQGGWSGLPRGREARPVVAPSAPTPGTDPGYNPAGIWILGELLRRRHGIPFAELIRDEVLLPTGMADSWNGMSADRFRRYGDRIVAGVGRINAPQVKAETAAKANPGGGGVGPTRDLARFYEMLLNGGEIAGNRLLRPETVAEMTALQATDGRFWAWGLGFHLNLNLTATDPTAATTGARAAAADLGPAGPRYGRYASARAFGHPGATGMVAFADPDAGLAVGLIGAGTDVIDAIYEDLGLA